jgi:hypothetical protein
MPPAFGGTGKSPFRSKRNVLYLNDQSASEVVGG